MRALPTRTLPALPAPSTNGNGSAPRPAEPHRLLPAAIDAEKGLLCSFFLAPITVGDLCIEKGITRYHFHHPAHDLIYGAQAELHRENEPVDFITVTQLLRDRGILDQAGGAAYITEVYTFIPTAANAPNYLEIVQENYTLREFIKTCTAGAAKGYESGGDVRSLLASTVDSMLGIVKLLEGTRIHTRDMGELVRRAIDRIQTAIDGDGTIDMPYGIPELDYETMGLRAPEVTVISGKSSDGKTALALNVAEHLAIHRGKKIGIISLEMSDDQLTDRLLASVAWTNIRDIKRSRQMTTDESEKIQRAADNLARAQIFIRDDGQLSIQEITATFTAWKAKTGLDIGIIDHAQLARAGGHTNGRTEEVEQISRALKPLAKKLEIPLIVLSQVTKGQKEGEYTTKNSMALTEDADNLLTISHTENGSWINISKQRDGARNISIPVVFIAHLGRFKAKAKEPDPELPMGGKKAKK